MKAEQALALHEKAHFVFAVGVFTQEFLAQIGTVWMIRLDANGINAGVGPSRLGSLDVGHVGRQNLLLAGTWVKLCLRWPAFKADPALLELRFDQGSVVGVQKHVAGAIRKQRQFTHAANGLEKSL